MGTFGLIGLKEKSLFHLVHDSLQGWLGCFVGESWCSSLVFQLSLQVLVYPQSAYILRNYFFKELHAVGILLNAAHHLLIDILRSLIEHIATQSFRYLQFEPPHVIFWVLLANLATI